MAAKKRRPSTKVLVGGALAVLARRIEDLEKLTGDNQRTLDVQFERIARIQADVDRLRAFMKRVE